MEITKLLRHSDTVDGLVRDLRKLPVLITKLFNQKKIIKNYLKSNDIKKLQLGAGVTTLPGWLSTDIVPASERVVYLDVTKPFPFNNDTFDYIYNEHIIEHISWHEGSLMLQECRRVLRPGGTIRIATPDLEVLIGLYNHPREPFNKEFINWITNRFLDGIDDCKASFVINNAFRNWGHQFLYDAELLEMAMQNVGFTNIQRYLPGKSDDENLCGIESHGKNVANVDMAAFETMVFEGKCPELERARK